MQREELPDHIRETAAQVRRRDFLWSLAIAGGVSLAVSFSGLSPNWWLPPAAWVSFVISLFVRYRFSDGRAWSAPFQNAIASELLARDAELENLRLDRGVAQALPEPLFILDGRGIIEHANPAAEELVGATDLEHRHFTAALRAPAVFDAMQEVVAGDGAKTVDFSTAGSVERHCRAFINPLQEGEAAPRVLIYVQDLTAERRLDRMRADFIASASHELRTPLASLLGFIETLRGHARNDPEAQVKFLAIMQSQAERMQRLVSDLMSLSRIEVDEHVPPRSAVNICLVAKELIEFMAPVIEQSSGDVSLVCECGPELYVEGDRDQLMQAIQNLVDNALKYGGERPHVTVTLGIGQTTTSFASTANRVGDNLRQLAGRNDLRDDDFAFVTVRDTGKGVPRSALPRLTERFYRVSIEDSRRAGGTGLGLAIVKHIINRHQGGFLLESAEGEGSAFTCYLRRHVDAGAVGNGDEEPSERFADIDGIAISSL